MVKLAKAADFVEIIGHADNTGEQAFNTRLARDRAERVREYLVTQGVTVDITVRSKGDAEPKESNTLPGGRAANRRVEVIFWKVTNNR